MMTNTNSGSAKLRDSAYSMARSAPKKNAHRSYQDQGPEPKDDRDLAQEMKQPRMRGNLREIRCIRLAANVCSSAATKSAPATTSMD
jgi:hypothetical protein